MPVPALSVEGIAPEDDRRPFLRCLPEMRAEQVEAARLRVEVSIEDEKEAMGFSLAEWFLPLDDRRRPPLTY